MSKRIIAIVPAAGTGKRALTAASGDLPKQYRLLQGEPMLRWSVKALLADPRVEQVRVAVAAHDTRAEHALSGLPRTVWRPCGGPSRAATVVAALQDANLDPDDWVLVHDAARPGLRAESLRLLINACLLQNVGGLLAQVVSDTVKRGALTVQATLQRDRLWLAQTPQMFPVGLLINALLAAGSSGSDITDESSAMEQAGYEPLLVPGSTRNFKVTWPEDFELMEKWL
jgi:2-C-methyl-D-erythritol 4-phosphate cytidylyltransferase